MVHVCVTNSGINIQQASLTTADFLSYPHCVEATVILTWKYVCISDSVPTSIFTSPTVFKCVPNPRRNIFPLSCFENFDVLLTVHISIFIVLLTVHLSIFIVLLTVHLSIILVINRLNAQILVL